MREAQPFEQTVGIAYYVSEAAGTGGRLRTEPEDFRVRELEAFDTEPVGSDRAAYPHLVVRATLRNWDTNDFAGALSNRLGISRERVSWAGTKDKRAVTTQLFSVDGVEPGELPDLADVEYDVIGRAGRPILFGDLAGNGFEVTIRDPKRRDTAAVITETLAEFAGQVNADGGEDVTVAVPNYFGQQRFGSRRPVTHKVGLAVVRGKWQDAVLAYVGNPNEREPAETQEARTFVDETRDWAGGLDRFPRHLGYERSMLQCLAERDNEPADFRAALETVPTNLQQLFVNAAQSYLFNRILSERLTRGLPFERPVTGDIVCFADRDAPPGLALPDQQRTQRVSGDRLDSVIRHCRRGRAFVTAPLVGTETRFAEGEPGEIERTVLEESGIAPADFDLPGRFHSEGTRRAVQVRTRLELDEEPLTASFRLPRGSYATVLLREYLKTDPAEL